MEGSRFNQVKTKSEIIFDTIEIDGNGNRDVSPKYDCDHKLKGCLVSILNASQAISLKVLVAFLLTVFLQVRT